MAAAINKKGATAPPQADLAGHGLPHQFIRIGEFAELANIRIRVAQKAAARAVRGKPWRGVRLVVREIPGRGGAGGRQYEIDVSSLPVSLYVKWRSQQPGAEAREQLAEHLACIEEDSGAGERRIRERTPWTNEEREAKHAAFSRLPTPTQQKAMLRFDAVHFFHSLSGIVESEAEHYDVTAREAGKSSSSIREWVELCKGLDRGDWLVALASKYKGYQGAVKISAGALNYIASEYFKLTKPSLTPIYRRAQKMAPEQRWALPSYSTVKRLIKAAPHSAHVLLRQGREAFERLYPAQQRDYSTLKLMEIWCCDGRKADVFCRWEDGTVSRPIVIAWLEVRSRVLLSYVIARSESEASVRLAFKAAVEKCRGAIPESVLLDNSRAFASKGLSGGAPNRFRFKCNEDDPLGIFTLMGISIIWALPFSGRSKPIESFFRQFAEAEKRFDGGAYCGNTPAAKPEDCDPKNAVPIEQYRRMIEETLAEYHARPHRGDAMENRSPREVYEALLPQCAPRQATREQLRLCLLAAERLRLARNDGSLTVLGNRYWSPRLAQLPRDRDYVARYNPEDAAEPIALFEGATFLCDAPIQ
jgi:putative transposase